MWSFQRQLCGIRAVHIRLTRIFALPGGHNCFFNCLLHNLFYEFFLILLNVLYWLFSYKITVNNALSSPHNANKSNVFWLIFLIVLLFFKKNYKKFSKFKPYLFFCIHNWFVFCIFCYFCWFFFNYSFIQLKNEYLIKTKIDFFVHKINVQITVESFNNSSNTATSSSTFGSDFSTLSTILIVLFWNGLFQHTKISIQFNILHNNEILK